MTRRLPVFLALLAAAALAGCSGEPPEDDAATFDPSLLPARAQYRTHCGACHGKSGMGAKRLYPPLRGSSWVNGPAEIPIRVVLQGVKGDLVVEGERYRNQMPPLGHRLGDDDIARILTYVRASWGNTSSPVTEEQVARVRAATSGRQEQWTEEDLRPLLNAVTP